ncbi:MAG: hypothetical protein ACOC8F_06685, partial [Planctomycetota bacterium]
MSTRKAVVMLAAAAAAALCGCGGGPGALLRGWFEPNAAEKVSMLYDETRPDRVRRGINLVSAEPWGMNAPYLKLVRTGRPWVIA